MAACLVFENKVGSSFNIKDPVIVEPETGTYKGLISDLII